MHDDALYQILRQDPEAGMRILIDQYAALIYAVVKGKLSPSLFCPADIEHCVADVFSEFYFDLDQYNPDAGSIKAWLCVIAKHNALDLLRKAHKKPYSVSLDGTDPCAQIADGFSLEANFEDQEMRLSLMQAIRDLGEPDHEIIVRKFFLSQTSREIAEVLNITTSNVDTRTHRAIRKLRERIGGDSLT